MNATEHSKVRLAFLTCFDFDAPGATVFRASTRGCLAQNYMQNGGHQLEPLSFTNISGGAARHEKVSPKTWRILAFADAIWFLSLQVFTTDQPRSRAFKKPFAPLAFAKKFYGLVVFGKKPKIK